MTTKKIDVFVTSIQSNHSLRGRHERVTRQLTSLRVPFTTHDVASSEEAKLFWKRKARGSNELPCILVDGEPVGTIEQFDDAAEFGELRQFLRLDEPDTASAATTSATLDDFADLDLTSAEFEQLKSELEQERSNAGYTPSAAAPIEHTFSFVPAALTEPLKVMGKGSVMSNKGRVVGNTDEEVIEGVSLTEEDALALVNELGLDDDNRHLVTGTRPSVSSAPAEPASETTTSTTQPPTAWSEATSVEGAGGAQLSAPIRAVDTLDLSQGTVQELKKEISETGTTIDVAPPTTSSPVPTPSPPPLPPTKKEEEPLDPKTTTTKTDLLKLKKDLMDDTTRSKKYGEEEEVPVALHASTTTPTPESIDVPVVSGDDPEVVTRLEALQLESTS